MNLLELVKEWLEGEGHRYNNVFPAMDDYPVIDIRAGDFLIRSVLYYEYQEWSFRAYYLTAVNGRMVRVDSSVDDENPDPATSDLLVSFKDPACFGKVSAFLGRFNG